MAQEMILVGETQELETILVCLSLRLYNGNSQAILKVAYEWKGVAYERRGVACEWKCVAYEWKHSHLSHSLPYGVSLQQPLNRH